MDATTLLAAWITASRSESCPRCGSDPLEPCWPDFHAERILAVAALPEQVLRACLEADKDPVAVLRASAAWLSAPAPVDAILTGVTR